MRLLRTAMVALLILVVAGPSAVADSTVVAHALQMPAGVDLIGASCADPNTTIGQQVVAYMEPTTDDPPTGLRMLGFDLTSAGDAVGPAAFTEQPSQNLILDLRADFPDGSGSGVAGVYYYPPNPTNGGYYVGRLDLSPPQGWSTVDASTATFAWTYWEQGVSADAGSGTLSAFVTGHGGDDTGDHTAGAYLWIGLGCQGEKFWFDRFQFGSAGDITTVDFEGYTSAVSIAGSSHRITAGRGDTLDGTPSLLDGSHYGDGSLTLLAKPYGASSFHAVGTAPTTYDGGSASQLPAELVVHPKKQTSYRWRVPTTNTIEGSLSPIFTVKVATAVTAKLADSTLGLGQRLTLTGTTTPAKPGSPVYLQRWKGGHWVNLASSTVGAKGAFTLSKRVGATGQWKVRAFVPAGSGNLAGHSPSRTASVSR